ncbi:MAG TPA: CRISPR-associated endonuclease Cas1 [Candidatus Limnocylindria bacterium]|nr:CRISPR-associated endonuclease Cas1 [Candidatus Limnocylindria bacterium]
MRTQTSALKPPDGLLTLSGYGIRIAVEHRHLVVADGVGRDRRSGALHRATARLKRLVVIGHSGFISLEAIRWLSDVGASYVQIDSDGGLIASYAPRAVNDVALRRAQALATTTDVGLEIAKGLITDKLEAQRKALQMTGDHGSAVRLIADAGRGIAGSATADELRWCEATAATAYWNALSETPMRFVRTELRRVPGHWLVFGSRHSALTNTTRKATSPASAMLNYLYAILESETRIALLARGLDPELGVFHALQRFRNSLAHDVMEPIRPEVDRFVLELLATRVFSAADFVETREGSCRLAPDLARILANTAPRWAARVRPVVARVAAELNRRTTQVQAPDVPRRPRFPGTLHRRVPGESAPDAPIAPMPRCAECGAPLSRARYGKCLSCERARQVALAPKLGGVDELARLRAAGNDPAHGGAAGRKRSVIASRRHAEALAATGRERLTAEERERFRREVLPGLSGISVSALSGATSLSKTYCSFIKRGLRVPHVRHWAAFKAAEG